MAAALAWLLIHSFWQAGLILGAVLSARLAIKDPALRARIANVGVALFLVGQLTTAYFLFRSSAAATFQVSSARITEMMSHRRPNGTIQLLQDGDSKLRTLLSNYQALLPVIGFLAAAVVGLMAAVGLFAVARLGRLVAACPEIDSASAERFTALAARLSVTRSVRYLACSDIRLPATAGQRRPVVLLPPRELLPISAGQLDAVILHELAHIRRHDFLANAVRAFARGAYLFNPMLYQLCRVASRDVEEAADELAAMAYGDRKAYAAALIAVIEKQSAQPLTLGLGGGDFRSRVVGLVHRHRRKRHRWDGLASLGALVLALASLGMTGRYVDLQAAESRDDAWLADRTLGQAIVDILAGRSSDAAFAEALRTTVQADRLDPTHCSLESLAKTAAELKSSRVLYRQACEDGLSRKSILDFGEFGTAAEIRTWIDRLEADSATTPGEARAAVLLAAELEVADGGARAGLLLRKSTIIERLGLSDAQLFCLQRAIALNDQRINRLAKVWAPAMSTDENAQSRFDATGDDLAKVPTWEVRVGRTLLQQHELLTAKSPTAKLDFLSRYCLRDRD